MANPSLMGNFKTCYILKYDLTFSSVMFGCYFFLLYLCDVVCKEA